jgi:hypothetical protein
MWKATGGAECKSVSPAVDYEYSIMLKEAYRLQAVSLLSVMQGHAHLSVVALLSKPVRR